MSFKILSKSELDALTDRELGVYEAKLEMHQKEQRDKERAEMKAELVAEAKEAVKEEIDSRIEAVKSESQLALEALAEKHKEDIAKFEAQLKRAKIAEINERLKGMSELIEEKLSTEEGEAMLKAFANGQRERFNMEMEAKALAKPTTSGGGVLPHMSGIVGEGHDELHMRDIIPTFPTISDIVKFVQMVKDTSADGIGTVAEGATKPDMGYIPTPKESPVRKIAGLLDITDEMLDDVVGLRAWLAYELPKAYLDAEDEQILKGDGTGTNLQGLYNQATALTLPLGSVTAASNVWDKLGAAITQVRKNKRRATVALVSPVSYMELLINKDAQESYTYPIIMGADNILRIGGVPIYWTGALNDNEALVGDFARGAAIFQRKAMTISYSDQHKDNFAKNIQTIRIEGRIALVVYYPDSFVKVDLTKTP